MVSTNLQGKEEYQRKREAWYTVKSFGSISEFSLSAPLCGEPTRERGCKRRDKC